MSKRHYQDKADFWDISRTERQRSREDKTFQKAVSVVDLAQCHQSGPRNLGLPNEGDLDEEDVDDEKIR